jgi:hypothetical protein
LTAKLPRDPAGAKYCWGGINCDRVGQDFRGLGVVLSQLLSGQHLRSRL